MALSKISNVTQLHLTGYTTYIVEVLRIFSDKPLKRLVIGYASGNCDIPYNSNTTPPVLKNLDELHVNLPHGFDMLLFCAMSGQHLPSLTRLTLRGPTRGTFAQDGQGWCGLQCASQTVQHLSLTIDSGMSPQRIFSDLLEAFPAIANGSLRLVMPMENATTSLLESIRMHRLQGDVGGFGHSAVVEALGRIPLIRLVFFYPFGRHLLMGTLSALKGANARLQCLGIEAIREGEGDVDWEADLRNELGEWMVSNVERSYFRQHVET